MIQSDFAKELTELLNRHGIDNQCETTDFILADMLCHHLATVGAIIKEREKWFGRSGLGEKTLKELK